MKKKLSLGMLLIIILFILGINDVNADTCTFFRDTNRRWGEYYIIELDSNGKLVKATYQRRNNNGEVTKEEDRTATTNVSFTTCMNVTKYTFDGSNNYVNLSKAEKDNKENSNQNSNGTPGWLNTEKVYCGNIGQIPAKGPELVHMFILIAQIAVPIILVILGMIDFAKGIMSQKEDEIKKGQKTFINRLIIGAVIFFIVALVKLLVGIVVDNSDNRQNIIACIDCFVNNDCG